MRPTKSAVRGITYRAWANARWYSRPATRVKDAPVQRRMPDAVASGIHVGISPKSRGVRARPRAVAPAATSVATLTATTAAARRSRRRSSQRGGSRATAANAATPLDARRPRRRPRSTAAPRSSDASTRRARASVTRRRKTRGASGPASRLASVWIGERATRPPAQAAAHGPAICPATRAARAAASAPASSDGRRNAVSDVPAARVQSASPTAWSGGPEAPRPTSSHPARRGRASGVSGRSRGTVARVRKPWLSTNAVCSAAPRLLAPRPGRRTAAARRKHPTSVAARASRGPWAEGDGLTERGLYRRPSTRKRSERMRCWL